MHTHGTCILMVYMYPVIDCLFVWVVGICLICRCVSLFRMWVGYLSSSNLVCYAHSVHVCFKKKLCITCVARLTKIPFSILCVPSNISSHPTSYNTTLSYYIMYAPEVCWIVVGRQW